MNQEGHGIRSFRIEVRRLDDPSVDGLVVPAGKGELLGVAHAGGGELVRVEACERSRVAAVGPDAVQFHRRAQVVHGEHDPVARPGHRAHVSVRDDRTRLAARSVDRKQRSMAEVRGVRVDRAAVLRPGQAARRTVPCLRQHAGGSVGPGPQHDSQAVGLVARHAHREVGQRLAVRRERRLRIPGPVGRREVLGRRRAVDADTVEIEVRGPGLLTSGVAGGEHEGQSIRRECVLLGTSERFGRTVRVHSLHHVHRLFAVDRQHEQVRPPPVLPCVPVTHQQSIVDASAGLASLRLVHARARTGDRLAVREDFHGHGDPLAVGRDGQTGHVER